MCGPLYPELSFGVLLSDLLAHRAVVGFKIIAAKIDVTKLDKNRFFPGKNGALYLDIVLMENRDGVDQYGNLYSIKQSQTKEEREAGTQMPFVGNAKVIGGAQPKPRQAQEPRRATSAQPEDSGGCPF